jgi:MGT family glycosyltransferase
MQFYQNGKQAKRKPLSEVHLPLSFLFTSWGNPGNLSPLLTAARRLRERGHTVRVLGDACNHDETIQAGFTCRSWQRPKPLRPVDAAGDDPTWAEIRMMFEQLMFGSALDYALDTAEELHRQRTDVVVTSDFLAGPPIAAEAIGIPYALLAPHVSIRPLGGVPVAGCGFAPSDDALGQSQEQAVKARLVGIMDFCLPALNHARTTFGLEQLGDAFDHYDRADRVLIGMSQAFDFPATSLPGNVRYVGPLLDMPLWSRPWAAPWSGEQRRPRILVSLSTSFQNQAVLLRRLIATLGRMDVDAVVTAGPALDDEVLPGSGNVSVVHSAPHDRVMKEVSLVITHGGHGTVTRSLVNGVPLLVLPMGRDQADNAARVVARGAGLSLRDDATEEAIAFAVSRLIREPGFQEAAARLGGQIATDVDSPVLVRELELIGQRRCLMTA